jgi:hypothetical protein
VDESLAIDEDLIMMRYLKAFIVTEAVVLTTGLLPSLLGIEL